MVNAYGLAVGTAAEREDRSSPAVLLCPPPGVDKTKGIFWNPPSELGASNPNFPAAGVGKQV